MNPCSFSFCFYYDMDFYDSAKWHRVRAAILARDGYLCQECKKFGRRTEAVTVHHIIHLEDNRALAYKAENLISLCRKCHNKAHPEKGGARY